jgi:hypothetical protein
MLLLKNRPESLFMTGRGILIRPLLAAVSLLLLANAWYRKAKTTTKLHHIFKGTSVRGFELL